MTVGRNASACWRETPCQELPSRAQMERWWRRWCRSPSHAIRVPDAGQIG